MCYWVEGLGFSLGFICLCDFAGLVVNYHAASKTALLACLPSCAGFRSRCRQLSVGKTQDDSLSAAYGWGEEETPVAAATAAAAAGAAAAVAEGAGANGANKNKGIIDLEVCSDTGRTDTPDFAKQKLYPPKMPWKFDGKRKRQMSQ